MRKLRYFLENFATFHCILKLMAKPLYLSITPPQIVLLCHHTIVITTFIDQFPLSRRQRKDLCGRVKLPPVYHTWWRLHTLHCLAGKLQIPIFIMRFKPTENRTRSTVSVAVVLSTHVLIGFTTGLT